MYVYKNGGKAWSKYGSATPARLEAQIMCLTLKVLISQTTFWGNFKNFAHP